MQIRLFRGSGEPAWVNAPILKCAFLFGTRSAQSIRASGHTCRINSRTRDRTRPMLQNVRKFLPGRRPHVTQSGHHSALSNVRVAVMVCPVRENVSGGVVIVRFFPLISK
jgi:hypothetical protein